MTTAVRPEGLPLGRELRLLTRLRWQVLRNSVSTGMRQHPWRWVLLSLIAAAFLVGDYIFFTHLWHYLLHIPGGFGALLITQLLTMIFLSFFSMLLFSNTVTALSTIYMSSDLLMLMSSPLRLKTIFLSKFYQTLLHSSWMVLLFGLPIFIAFGQVRHAPLPYYLWLLPVLLPFLVIPAGAGILFTMVLMRYFPARQTHKALTILSVFCMTAVVMFIRFLRPERLVQEAADAIILQFLDSLKVPDFSFLPSTWASKALLVGVGSLPGNILPHVILLWIGAAVSLGLSVWVASHVYYSGWAAGGSAAQPTSPRRARQLEWLFTPVLRVCAAATRGLLLKDVKIFLRDPAQWSQLFLLGALVVIYLYNIQHLPLNTVFLKNMVAVLNLGLAGFVLSAVAARFVFTSTSLEGRCFWSIMVSPMPFRSFLRVKFFMYFCPLLGLAETLVVLSNLLLKADAFIMLFSVVTILLMTCGLTGLGVGLGAMFPRFQYENIAETAMSPGGILYMVLSLGFVSLTVFLAARPLYVHLSRRFLYQSTGGIDVYLCYIAIALLCFLTTLLPLRLGRQALERLEM